MGGASGKAAGGGRARKHTRTILGTCRDVYRTIMIHSITRRAGPACSHRSGGWSSLLAASIVTAELHL